MAVTKEDDTQIVSFGYDPAQNRLKKSVVNTATNINKDVYYISDVTDWSRSSIEIGCPQAASKRRELRPTGSQHTESTSGIDLGGIIGDENAGSGTPLVSDPGANVGESEAAGSASNTEALAQVFTWKEQYLYGSSRLGGITPLVQWTSTLPDVPTYTDSLSLGWKYYEAGNHLGNVLSVASDRKIKVDSDGDSEANYFEATILSATDYYPFGDRSRARHPKCLVSEGNEAPTPQRSEEWMGSQDAHQERSCGQDMPYLSFANTEYRYGINDEGEIFFPGGKSECLGDIQSSEPQARTLIIFSHGYISDINQWGDGNQYDYGFRIYNPELGRFLSVDPLSISFPWNSVHAFAENDVIRSIDLEGAERFVVIFSPMQAE